jgi:hypothetical protein
MKYIKVISLPLSNEGNSNRDALAVLEVLLAKEGNQVSFFVWRGNKVVSTELHGRRIPYSRIIR